jgi:putative phosphoesterase
LLTAFISDIHANLPALEAAVSDSRKRGVSQMFCAGDITGYGPFPDEVCDYLQEFQIAAIAGNYDAKVLMVIKEGTSSIADLQKRKQNILLWTADHISKRTREYLAGLPETLNLDFPGGLKILVVHGTPLDNDDDLYPSVTQRGLKAKMGDAQADILVCGHTHIPFVKRVNGVLVVNCGSVGQPVDGDPRLSYAIVSLGPTATARGRIVRAEYDSQRTIDAMKQTSLPKGLRRDLTLGTKRMFLQ